MTRHGEAVRTRILHAIFELTAETGYRPTIQQIADRVGIGRSTAFKHLDELRKRGIVALDRRFAGWRVITD